MAKGKSKRSAVVDRAAQVVGRAVGGVADTIESFQGEHPHPVEEAREALATGQEALSAAAANAGVQAAAIIKKVKAVARRTKTAVTRARNEKQTRDGPCDADGRKGSKAREEGRHQCPEGHETGRNTPEEALDSSVLAMRLPAHRADLGDGRHRRPLVSTGLAIRGR